MPFTYRENLSSAESAHSYHELIESLSEQRKITLTKIWDTFTKLDINLDNSVLLIAEESLNLAQIVFTADTVWKLS